MDIREYRTYNEAEILRLYASVGWAAYTDHRPVLRKGFENSMLTLAAYGNGQSKSTKLVSEHRFQAVRGTGW